MCQYESEHTLPPLCGTLATLQVTPSSGTYIHVDTCVDTGYTIHVVYMIGENIHTVQCLGNVHPPNNVHVQCCCYVLIFYCFLKYM